MRPMFSTGFVVVIKNAILLVLGVVGKVESGYTDRFVSEFH